MEKGIILELVIKKHFPTRVLFDGIAAPTIYTSAVQVNAVVPYELTGAVLKSLTQPGSVTVGGLSATVAFAGAAPTFVDGLLQLNIRLADSTPSGTQPLRITVGGVSSPAGVTLAVQ